ncbi:hypothetical protein GKO32_34650 [Amycolatopsis sp. RM579]|uniref:AbrB/MazE/SpoVT family DNA-binding domain-containing protein n=1 Tax=Amycolatopsis pithecellobii TaxID=664692 RepID=A0A6N7ZBK0_9PSEU|nr:hypothetical protein [Amycolatopsis pithecellobii]
MSVAPMESSGRIQDRRIVKLLGWAPGDRLTMAVIETSVVIRRREDGAFHMTTSPYVALPAPVRARCHLTAGCRVLLVPDPQQDALIVHPSTAVARMLQWLHTHLAGGDPR